MILIAAIPSAAYGTQIYWAEDCAGSICRAPVDGTNLVEVLVNGVASYGIAIDPSAGKMYWTDWNTSKIQTANLDGSNVKERITDMDVPLGIGLDLSAGKMYWTDFAGKIQRANLDGTNFEPLVTGLSWPHAIAIDPPAGKMYWTDADAGKIQRANLDGSGLEDLHTGVYSFGVAVDPTDGSYYWTDIDGGKIWRDGEVLLLSGLELPVSIAVDAESRRIYWLETNWDGMNARIRYLALDGSNVPHDAVTGLCGLLVPIAVPEPATMGLLVLGGLAVIQRRRR
jgi:low density lipoprotein receptor-related protein 5/6